MLVTKASGSPEATPEPGSHHAFAALATHASAKQRTESASQLYQLSKQSTDELQPRTGRSVRQDRSRSSSPVTMHSPPASLPRSTQLTELASQLAKFSRQSVSETQPRTMLGRAVPEPCPGRALSSGVHELDNATHRQPRNGAAGNQSIR